MNVYAVEKVEVATGKVDKTTLFLNVKSASKFAAGRTEESRKKGENDFEWHVTSWFVIEG